MNTPWKMVPNAEPVDVGEFRQTMQDCYTIYGPGEGSDFVADVFVPKGKTFAVKLMEAAPRLLGIVARLAKEKQSPAGETPGFMDEILAEIDSLTHDLTEWPPGIWPK